MKSAEKGIQFGPDKCHTMNITRSIAQTVEKDLYFNHLSEKHIKKDQIINTFEGMLKMKNVEEQKYLGFVISEDGSNLRNIEAKEKRSIGIIKQIQFLIQGLGKYTIECGMIYLNSLLRSSILFAAEAMYDDIKENEYRKIERMEEDLLRKLFKTAKVCPIFQLCLQSGHLPARFHIKQIKLFFFFTNIFYPRMKTQCSSHF